MTTMDPSMEHDLVKLWTLVVELSEQLAHTKQVANSLYSESIKIKEQAVHNEIGFVLRRFNLHLSQEEYDVELEHMNAAVATENMTLQNENKQLSSLLKEYEQTLESVMTAFRKHAHGVQLRELETIRLYELLILQSETASLKDQLAADTFMGGEEPVLPPHITSLPTNPVTTGDETDLQNFETRCAPDLMEPTQIDWALGRDIELERLKKENAELRMLLKVSEQADDSATANLPLSLPKIPLSAGRLLTMRGNPRSRGRASHNAEPPMADFGLHQLQSPGTHEELMDVRDEAL